MKPRSRTRPPTRQTGYALILMVVVLMGIGGAVVTGFTQGVKQQAEHERYLHNQRILKDAKQALLQYAYNYPINNPDRGPGRLPCPDTDNTGSPNSSFNCIAVGAAMVGRFPWDDQDLNFYDARDASGSRLWYAVSQNFANSISPTTNDVINSDTNGTIAIEDRSGAVLYDAVAGNGVAAVIFAPGPPIVRDGVLQDRVADNNEVTYYLDKYSATVDNANFVNGTADGFVTGPIFNPVDGSLAVNDQMIVITAAEVIAMAEKATLQAYRNAIDAYLAPVVDGGTGGVYPWLFNYDDVDTIAKLSSYYPADPDFGTNPDYHDNYGRIPSIFGNYFVRGVSELIENELEVTLTNDYTDMPTSVTSSASGNLQFFNGALPDSVRELTVIDGFLPVGFTEDGVSPNGRLSVTLAAEETLTQVLYFWDEEGAPTGFWKICPDDGDGISQLSDCHRDSSQNPDPGGPNDSEEEILRVEIKITIGEVVNDGEVAFDVDYATDATITKTAPLPNEHATITADNIDFSDLDLGPSAAPTITATYQIDHHYLQDGSGNLYDIEESGDLTVAELLGGATLTVDMRYFPELPIWAYANGWHNSVIMAYASDYRPDQNAAAGDCGSTPPCLELPDTPGGPQDKVSLLVIAGEHNWVDEGVDGYQNDLVDVFDPGNQDSNESFYAHDGNDEILVIEEL
jgi:type II secretory pathway pseudopilin PulG